MSSVRRSTFVLALAGARLRRRAGAVLLAALGIAAGAATLTAVLAAGSVAQDQSLGRAVLRLPPEQRVIRASWFGAYSPGLDATVFKALHGISADPPIRALLFRQTSVDGKVFNLGAVDRLAAWVRVRSGRLPRVCSPRLCEVLQVAGSGPIPDAPGLRLRRVGRGDLVSSVPFLQTSAYGRTVEDSYSFTSPRLAPPFLLTNDVSAAAALPLFRLIHRSDGWIVPVGRHTLHPWSLDDLSAKIARARSTLTTSSDYFDLSDPLSQLAPTVSANKVTARRLLLVGGQAAALLLAFVVLAAASARAEAEATRSRLARFGARRWQAALLSTAEAAALAFVATIVGWSIGIVIAAALADGGGAPIGGVLVHSSASAEAVGVMVGLAAVATLVLLIALHAPVVSLARSSLSIFDVAALGAVVAIALAFARGAADADSVAREGGTGVLLFLLPALIAFVAAVLAFRVLGPALRGLERLARRMPISARLAALSLARNPGYAGAAAAFLLVSVGLAAFSVDYRSTLRRAQSDQARFQTPADVVLSQNGGGPALDRVVPARTAKRAIPVLRVDAQVGSGAASKSVTVLGLPAAAIRTLPFWRSDFASSSLGRLADRVDPGAPVALDGVRLPARARTLSVAVTDDGDRAVATASIATEGGTFVTLDLGAIAPGSSVLRAPIPARARGGLLIGLAFAPTLPEVHNARPASGTLVLGPFKADRTALRTSFASWLATGGMHLRRSTGRARLSFFLTNDRDAGFRPRQQTDASAVRVIATPSLAAIAGESDSLPVRVEDVDVPLRVAVTARRFPSTAGDFVVADESALQTLLNTVAPGSAVVREVWLDGVSSRGLHALVAAVGRPPLFAARATVQSRVEAGLRDDPLARAVLRTLAASALVAFALALGGLLLALAADVRDEHGELSDLEAQGAGPSLLRRHLRLRSTAVVGAGILGGAALGAVLSVLVVAAVLVTANGGVPEPPLILSVDWTLLGLGLVAYVACALALVSLVTWNAFRREAAT
jgi:hypothetical protein